MPGGRTRPSHKSVRKGASGRRGLPQQLVDRRAFVLGAALLDRAHIRIDSLYVHFHPALRVALDLAGLALFLAFFGLVTAVALSLVPIAAAQIDDPRVGFRAGHRQQFEQRKLKRLRNGAHHENGWIAGAALDLRQVALRGAGILRELAARAGDWLVPLVHDKTALSAIGAV
mgnify:CR=1 FL=1